MSRLNSAYPVPDAGRDAVPAAPFAGEPAGTETAAGAPGATGTAVAGLRLVASWIGADTAGEPTAGEPAGDEPTAGEPAGDEPTAAGAEAGDPAGDPAGAETGEPAGDPAGAEPAGALATGTPAATVTVETTVTGEHVGQVGQADDAPGAGTTGAALVPTCEGADDALGTGA